MQSMVYLHSNNGKLVLHLRVILLPHPFFKKTFPLISKPANTGLSLSVAFDYKAFIKLREVTSSGQNLVMNTNQDTLNINVNSHVKPHSILSIQE